MYKFFLRSKTQKIEKDREVKLKDLENQKMKAIHELSDAAFLIVSPSLSLVDVQQRIVWYATNLCAKTMLRNTGGYAWGQFPKSVASTLALESWIFGVAANSEMILWKIVVNAE